MRNLDPRPMKTPTQIRSDTQTTVPSTVVAREILNLANQEALPIDPLKMMKLVYLCHGWSLAFRDDPLIQEEVEAWQYGPVIPDLYHEIKKHRSSPIDSVSAPIVELQSEQRAIIKSVFDAYKTLSGIQLSDLTHQSGTPWSDVWQSGKRSSTIPTSRIAAHFDQLKRERATV